MSVPILSTNVNTINTGIGFVIGKQPSSIGGIIYPFNAGGDPYWNNVVCLLHFNGINEQTSSFVDSGPLGLPITVANSGSFTPITYTSTNPKFGDTCLSYGGYAIVGNSSDFFVSGTEDYTIETWFRYTLPPTATASIIIPIITLPGTTPAIVGALSCGMYAGFATFGSPITPFPQVWGLQYSFFSFDGDFFGGARAFGGSNTYPTPLVDTWYHIAVVRSGTGSLNTKVYFNGVNTDGWTSNASISGNSGLSFGIPEHGKVNQYFTLDEFRWTRGVARYTGAFTPSTTQFVDYSETP